MGRNQSGRASCSSDGETEAQKGEHFACSQGTQVWHPAWTPPRTAPGCSPHPEGLQLVVGLLPPRGTLPAVKAKPLCGDGSLRWEPGLGSLHCDRLNSDDSDGRVLRVPVLAPPHYRQVAMALGGDILFQDPPCSPGPQNQGSSVQRGLCLLDAPAEPEPEWLLQKPQVQRGFGKGRPRTMGIHAGP